MSRAVASAAAAHAHHAARQEALAALKAALAAQSTTAADAPSTTGETSKAEGESAESGDSRAATGASATSIEGARAAKSVVPTTAAVAGPQEGDRAAGIDSGGDHAGEGGSKRRGQAPPADVPAPVRLSGSHSSQAIAAFQAAAMAGAGVSSPREVVASGGGTFGRALLDAELPASIVHSVHLQAAKGGGEARISLNPGFLGEMTVGVQVDGASVVASLHASNADVRDWIRTNEAMLRQALAEQGFNLERLVVLEEETADASGEQSPHEQDDHEQRPRRQPRTAAQGSFEALI
jgi:flagellar hook-length control protein FliK